MIKDLECLIIDILYKENAASIPTFLNSLSPSHKGYSCGFTTHNIYADNIYDVDFYNCEVIKKDDAIIISYNRHNGIYVMSIDACDVNYAKAVCNTHVVHG